MERSKNRKVFMGAVGEVFFYINSLNFNLRRVFRKQDALKGNQDRCLLGSLLEKGTDTSIKGRTQHDCIGESASRSLINFGVSNDNLNKYLISCVKCISNFLMKV
jgi:hypothetical protein